MLKLSLSALVLSPLISVSVVQAASTPDAVAVASAVEPEVAASVPKKHYLHGPKMYPRGKPAEDSASQPHKRKYGD